MAPRPQNTQAAAPATSSQSSTKALPGMKRGIAIGVAVSIATILIALLAYCAVQRRKKAKAKAKTKTLSSYTDSEAWPKDQKWPLESPVVEADAQTIHELEASPIPELATTHPAQELEGAQSPISELDSARSGPDSDTAAHGEKLLEWRSWNQALEGRNINQVDDQPHPPHPSSRREPPTLSISPPDNSTCPRLSLSPLGTSPMGLSPISVSPLEDAYFPNRRFSTSNNNR